MNSEKLKDVIVNLLNDKYSKKEIIDALAWGEKNIEIMNALMEKYQPQYYCDNFIFVYITNTFENRRSLFRSGGVTI